MILILQNNDTLASRQTIRVQKEEEEKEKEKQQEKETVLGPDFKINSDVEFPFPEHNQTTDVREIIAFWDDNGFGLTNIHGKQQLLAWLDDSSFLQPKDVIVKAMTIACANNKRKLSYVVGILKNWESNSLLSVKEIDFYQQNQKTALKSNAIPSGRVILSEFELEGPWGQVHCPNDKISLYWDEGPVPVDQWSFSQLDQLEGHGDSLSLWPLL